MTRKILALVLVCFVMCMSFGVMVSHGVNGGKQASRRQVTYWITGDVYDSYDGKVEIYNDTTGDWVCKNITVYPLEDIVPPYIENGTTDEGENYADYDTFKFDARWRRDEEDKEGMCVGEVEINQVSYVFITSFVFKKIVMGPETGNFIGSCDVTEWEPISEPTVYLKGDTWINLSIPKFTNPRVSALEGGGTPNADNTIGFAVYRDGVCLGGTTIDSATHYFFNDTFAADNYTAQNYSVKVIAKGGYCVGAPPLPVPSVTIVSPKAGDRWTGNKTQEIVYVIGGGVGPYTVYLNYSTDDGDTFSLINVTSEAFGGTHTYLWVPPLFAGDADHTKINVTVLDSLGRSCSALSGRFTIDCTAPSITVNSPLPDATNVSIFAPIDIQFSESVDELTLTISSYPLITLAPTWPYLPYNTTRVIFYHPEAFESNRRYDFSIYVKDRSLPGNTASTTWSFTTTSRISLSLLFPYSGARLTGNVTQEIKYVVGGGIDPYNVTIQFWNGTSWGDVPELNINLTGVFTGTYTGSWKPPALNIDNAKLKLSAEDAQPDIFECEYTFGIDSISPTIVEHYPKSDGILPTTASLRIVFSEAMNKTSVIESFSLIESATNAVVNVTPNWENDRTIILTPEIKLTSLTNYTVSIAATAKDISIPGNSLEEVRWNFTALEGRGDLIVDVDFPILPKKGDTGKIVVTVYNTGGKAYNYSGMIVIKFYQSEDGISWTELEGSPKTIPGLLEGAHASRNITLTFERAGDYYFRVEVYSMNPLDLINDRTTSLQNPWGTSAFIRVEEPPSLIGPYALIALMVLIVIVIGFLIIASYRKGMEKRKE